MVIAFNQLKLVIYMLLINFVDHFVEIVQAHWLELFLFLTQKSLVLTITFSRKVMVFGGFFLRLIETVTFGPGVVPKLFLG